MRIGYIFFDRQNHFNQMKNFSFLLLDFAFFFIVVIIDNPPEIKRLSGYYLKYKQFSYLPSSDTNSGLAHQICKEILNKIRQSRPLAHQEQQPEQHPQHPIEVKR